LGYLEERRAPEESLRLLLEKEPVDILEQK
jgi:hypothetical protein